MIRSVTLFCFRHVRRKSRQFRRWRSSISRPSRHRNSSFYRREIKLLRTLCCSVFVFFICWTPYLICALLHDSIIPDELKNVRSLSCAIVHVVFSKIKSSLYSRYYAEAYNEWRSHSAAWRLGNIATKKRRSGGEPQLSKPEVF